MSSKYLVIFNGGDGDIAYQRAGTIEEANEIFEENNDEGMSGIFEIDLSTGDIKRLL